MGKDSLNTYLYLTGEQIIEGIGGVIGLIIYMGIVFYFNVPAAYYHAILVWIITWTVRKTVLNLYRMRTKQGRRAF